MTNDETTTILDHKRLNDGLRLAMKKSYLQQVDMMRREEAWKWLLKTEIIPMLEGIEHIQAFINDSLSHLEMQLYGDYTDQMEDVVSVFMNSDRWRPGTEQEDEDGNKIYYYISKYNNTVEYKFYPDGDLWRYMCNRFPAASGYAYVYYEVRFKFFISDDAECEIVKLGTEYRTEKYEKIGLKCKPRE